jgi:sec-independent protein translocase protein TatC
MGFFDHLEELRKRIIYSVISLLVFGIGSAFFIDFIMNEILLKPAVRVGLKLQNLQPFGQPFLYFKTIFAVALIFSAPFLLYQIWKFVAPGLYENERKWVRSITFFTSLCFFSGAAFSYFVMIPSMLDFAQKFGSSAIENRIDINQYFSFVSMMILASGATFEMPMISFVLAKFGIINSKTMRKYWRHAIVVILIIAAVVTPTPDPISQLIFAAPLVVLFEISVWVAKIVEKKK